MLSFAGCGNANTANNSGLPAGLENYELVPELSDEFDGTSLNTDKWNIYTGIVHNNEKQTYVDVNKEEFKDFDPTVVVQDGKLVLKAYKKAGKWYAGKVQSDSNGEAKGMPFTYGYIEDSLKMPKGEGVWPAFWLMPDKSVYGGWPNSGELDIMEYSPSKNGTETYATYHRAYESGGHFYKNMGRKSFADVDTAFHRYGMLWTEQYIYNYYDGEYIGCYMNPMKPKDKFCTGKTFTGYDEETGVSEVSWYNCMWPYDKDFYVILNLAMGGDLGGDIDPSLTETQYEIDYVRVYKPKN